MFDDIGGKIKAFAKIVCWIGIIGSCLSGLILIINEVFFLGLVTAAAGSLGSWLSSFFVYGFGELIENTAIIAANTRKTNSISPTAPAMPKPNVAPTPRKMPVVPIPVTPVAGDTVVPGEKPGAPVVINSDSSWTCPKCGRRNMANRTVCWSCDYQR